MQGISMLFLPPTSTNALPSATLTRIAVVSPGLLVLAIRRTKVARSRRLLAIQAMSRHCL